MLFNNLGRAALAAVAATAALAPSVLAADKDDEATQSTFVSPDSHLAFAFSVPNDGTTDVYFSMRVPTRFSWGAVGLGSDDMKGALFLMMYQNERGDNVTFSPRLAFGNYEPKHYEDLEYEALEGTGVYDDHMVLNARCIDHCRSWPAGDTNSGYIDVSSATQKAIYAVGPTQGFGSDDPEQGLRYHQEYGVFTIDFKRTKGADIPALNDDSENVGTTLERRKTDKSDWKSTLHAVVMVISFVLIMPFGVVLLRLGGLARWHGLNQSIALFGVLVGFAMGIVTSFKYQRSRGFDSYHQIIGIIVTAFMLGQFSLGFLHHRLYKKTQMPTKYINWHRWLGRGLLFFGILNAFFGFTFALNRKYGTILAGLIIMVAFAGVLVLIGLRFLDKQKRLRGTVPGGRPPPGYQPEPWRRNSQPDQGASYPTEPPPGYEASASASSSHIDLRPVSPSPWRRNSAEGKEFDDGAHLGSAQRPREFA